MILPPWLQAEARRALSQMKPQACRDLARELDLSAETRGELLRSAAQAAAKHPAVRSVLDRIREDLAILAEAERERREGRR